MDEALKPLFERGLKVRKEVLGDAYVDNALNTADEFSMPLQEYITAHAWASSWARPGLEKKTRSMINLAMLTALNRGHEFRIHVKGALNNGVTKEEIREILIQSAVYCGAPATVLLVMTSLRGNGLSPTSTQICQSVSKLRKARCSHSTPSITPRPMCLASMTSATSTS